jgi:hypothetical protein
MLYDNVVRRHGLHRKAAVLAAFTSLAVVGVTMANISAPAHATECLATPGIVINGLCIDPGVDINGVDTGFDGTSSGYAIGTAGGADAVNGLCEGKPVTGSFSGTTYAVYATAVAAGPDVPLATGVTCRVWDYVAGIWLSGPISGSAPGAVAVATAPTVFIAAGAHPIGCSYSNALFTGNVTAEGTPADSWCPRTP